MLRVILTLLLTAAAVKAATVETFDEEQFVSAVSAKLTELGVPGAGISLVFADDDAPRSYGFGTANEALGTGVSASTIFLQASVSKTIVGTLAAMLVSSGTVALDEDINTYLGWGSSQLVMNAGSNITIRHLMTHSSGMVSGAPHLASGGDPSMAPTGVNGAVGNPSCPLDALEAWFKDLLFAGNTGGSGVGGTLVSDLGGWNALASSGDNEGIWLFAPGAGVEYSNLGTSLLCLVLAKAHGAASCAALSDELFVRLGMTSTSWFMVDDYNSKAAMPYMEDEPVGHWCFIDYPSGQLRTTPSDFGRFLKVLLDRGALSDGTRLFDAATAESYFACQTPEDATAASEEYTSFQWFIDLTENVGSVRGVTNDMMSGGLQHEGQVNGVDTLAAVMPGAGFAFAIMTNSDEGASGLLPTVLKHSLLVKVVEMLNDYDDYEY